MASLEAEQRLANARIELLRGHAGKVLSIAWNKNGTILASGSADGTIRLWEMDATGKSRNSLSLRSGNDGVDLLCWSPDDPFLLASGSGTDKTIRFWNAKTGRLEQALQTRFELLHLAWHPDGPVLAGGSRSDELFFVDARRGSIDARKAAVVFSAQMSYEMNEVAWSPSGLLFISAGPKNAVDNFEGVVHIAKPRDGFGGIQVLARLPGHTGQIQCLRFHPGGRHLATCGTDGVIALWSLDDAAVVRTFDRLDYGAKIFSFSHDGQFFATASDDKIIDITRVADGTRVRAITSGIPDNKTKAVAWAPHALLLAFSCEDDVRPGMSAQQYQALPPEQFAVRVVVPAAR